MILMLVGCGPAAIELGTGEPSDIGARLTALEAEAAALRADVETLSEQLVEADAAAAELQARVDALSVGGDLEDLRADVDALAARLEGVEELVDAIGTGGLGVEASDYSEPVARGGGTGSSWEAMTSADLEVTVTSASTVIAWCTVTTSDTDTQVRMRIRDEEGTYTDTAEASGDGTQPLSYPGEVVTVMGLWRPEQDGTLYVGCEGRYASPSDVHILGIVL